VSALGDEFRRRAKDQREAANTILAAADLQTSAEKQITATVGHVNANLLDALADLVDYDQAKNGADRLAVRRLTILERNDAIRTAAARGDWAEFDRLAGIGVAPASPPGGDGAARGD